MKRSHLFIISVICLVLMIVGFTYGYSFLGKRLSRNAKPNTSNEQSISKIDGESNLGDEMTSIQEDNIISPNTTIEYVIYYLQCGDKVTKTGKPSKDIINMTEEGFKSLIDRSHNNWRVTEFSKKKIVIEIDKEQLCPNHFIIGVQDEKIAIFKIDEDGERVLDKILDNAPISMLKEVDQQRLREGIIVDNEEEISNILENFIS